MTNIGRPVRRFEVNKSALKTKIVIEIIIVIACIIFIFSVQNNLNEYNGWFVSSSDRDLYNTWTTIGIITALIEAILAITDFCRMNCYITVCEYGIEGRASGNSQFVIAYTDIAEVNGMREKVIIQTKYGQSLSLMVKDGAVCVNMIKSVIHR